MILARTPRVCDVWDLRTRIIPGGSLVELDVWCSQFAHYNLKQAAVEGLRELANAIVVAASVRPGVTLAIEVQQGVWGVDPLKLKYLKISCKCKFCLGEERGTSGRCKYQEAGVTTDDREIAAFDPELTALMWELPWSLYTLAVEDKRARGIRALRERELAETPEDPAALHANNVDRLKRKMAGLA